jgi:hypothetical protein
MEKIKLTGNETFNKVIETIEKMDFVVRSGTPNKFIDSAVELEMWKVLLCIVFPNETDIKISIMIHDNNIFRITKQLYYDTSITINDDLEYTVKNGIKEMLSGEADGIIVELDKKARDCITASSELDSVLAWAIHTINKQM